MSSKGKRKYYKQANGSTNYGKKTRVNELQAGDRGFLIFCATNTEGKAIREAYDLLNQYVHVKNVSEFAASDVLQCADDSDVEKALTLECKDLKEEKRPFNAVETGARCCCFVRSDLEEKPSILASRIFQDLRKGESKSRFIQRLLPIDFTFRAISDQAFVEACSEFIDKCVQCDSASFTTYAVVFRSRNNTNITKETAYECLGNAMTSVNPTLKVNLESPERVVLIEIFSRVGCMSFLPDYYELCKYNVHEVVRKTASVRALEQSNLPSSNATVRSADVDTSVKSAAVTESEAR